MCTISLINLEFIFKIRKNIFITRNIFVASFQYSTLNIFIILTELFIEISTQN